MINLIFSNLILPFIHLRYIMIGSRKIFNYCKWLPILLLSIQLHAQCNLTINTFPYTENFEITNGGWVSGGNVPSWAWGSPTKPLINVAASGTSCWVIGGLTNGAYNNGEASWIQSPCFNFSNLNLPMVSFKIWWETETDFDGSNLQYSIDNGLTWGNVGSNNDATDCLDSNWYNSSSVKFLSNFSNTLGGWCGNIQTGGGGCRNGNGSGGWVMATKVMPYLANVPAVIFRLTFGAGTQCNNFDGVAFDDFSITNAPNTQGNIAIDCIDEKTIECTFASNNCPISYAWNFGDVAAGANNVSTDAIPRHIFSAAGKYTVTLTVITPGNASFTTNKNITILQLITSVASPIKCTTNGTGAITVVAIGNGTSPLQYSWNTNPIQRTDTAFNVSAGNYIVTATNSNSCTATATVAIIAPIFTVTDTVQQPGCIFTKGNIELKITIGVGPYNYSWLPSVSTDSIATNLLPGNYSVTITDSRNCLYAKQYTIATLPLPTIQTSIVQIANCNGQQLGIATTAVQNGTAPYTYNWLTNPPQNTATATALPIGNTSIIATDNNGCMVKDSVQIMANGVCNNIYFANSFAPNGINSSFGPLGNVLAISKYQLLIYNRYGQIIFSSNNPLQKWDGTFKGNKQTAGTYIWVANYTYNGLAKKQKGFINLLR